MSYEYEYRLYSVYLFRLMKRKFCEIWYRTIYLERCACFEEGRFEVSRSTLEESKKKKKN